MNSVRLATAARSFRPSRLVTAPMVIHVALKLALLPIVVRTPLQGDGATYDAGARAVATVLRSFLSGDGLPIASMQEHVVGYGWFMPACRPC